MADTLTSDDGSLQIYRRPDGSQYAVQSPNGPVANKQALTDKAAAALAANATFLAIGAPTNAQTLAQVQKLTRQMNALIRIDLNLLDDITGT
jgi:hypothetical protein